MIRKESKPLPSPADTAKAIESVIAFAENKPPKPPKKQPYYNEEYARQAKILLDRLHTNGRPLRINCKELSVTTTALQYYQGAGYLKDHDPTGHYATLFAATKCTKEPAHEFVELRIRRRSRSLDERVTEAAPWKEDFLRFIEEAQEGDRLSRADVSLTPDDIAWANNQLIGLDKMFIYKIEPTEILVIRHTES